MSNFGERIKKGWSAFMSRDPTPETPEVYDYWGSYRSSRLGFARNDLKSMVSFIYNQIAVDCASINVNHVRLDENGRYKETMKSGLNRALTKEANIDQTGRVLMEDVVYSMLEEGCVAIVPVLTEGDPNKSESYDVYELRAGRIVRWYPKEVEVDLYNENTGQHVNRLLSKSYVAIVENPFYAIMNEPNSTGQRLRRVLNQLDRSNEGTDPGKLDLIVQLPYSLKSEAQQKQAANRKKNIEAQLTGSKLGIAYIDGTERIIQLNRSLENNLWTQAKELTEQFYNQMGFSKSIFDGTADEKTMLNYNNRTIEPIMSAITEEMERKWLSRTAITQGQAIRFFKDPFKLVPVAQLAEIADKFTRNEIMTSNEIRSIIGLKPVNDQRADELRNSNLNHPDEEGTTNTVVEEVVEE